MAWDEPDLLQGVSRVSPWLVEMVSNIPPIHLAPLSPPRKKLRLAQQADLSFLSHLPMPPPFSTAPLACTSSNSALSCITDNITTDIQGARHARYGPSPLDLFPANFHPFHHSYAPPRIPSGNFVNSNLVKSTNGNREIKLPRHILLFGQVILPQDQTSQSSSNGSGSGVQNNGPPEQSSDEGSPQCKNCQNLNLGLGTSHCKVFLDSENVGQTLDLSVIRSYEDLYRKLAEMFGTKSSEMFSNVLYGDASGLIRHVGDESFR